MKDISCIIAWCRIFLCCTLMISFHLALRGTAIAGHCRSPAEMLWVQGSYCWFCFAWLETCLSQLLCLGKRMKLRSEITCSVNEIFANGISLPKQPYQRAMWCQEQQIFLHKLMGRGKKKTKKKTSDAECVRFLWLFLGFLKNPDQQREAEPEGRIPVGIQALNWWQIQTVVYIFSPLSLMLWRIYILFICSAENCFSLSRIFQINRHTKHFTSFSR